VQGVKSKGTVTVTFDELASFFQGPTEHLLSRRLNLWLRERAEGVEDREPVELDGLQRWYLRRELLRARLKGLPDSEVRDRMRAEGTLPLGFAGEAVVRTEVELVDTMLAESRVWPAGSDAPMKPNAPVSIDVALPSARLTGSVSGIYGRFLVEFRHDREEKGKHLVRLWLSLLAWHASAPKAGRAILVLGSFAKGKPVANLFGYEAPADPAACLERLVAIYLRGCTEPIKLFPGASWSFAWAARKLASDPGAFAATLPSDPKKLDTVRKAYEKALGAWFPGYSTPGDVGDAYIGRVFEGAPPMFDPRMKPVPLDLEFARLAFALWGPLFPRRVTASKAAPWIERGLR
jgi:exonuclease V gamma subunit